MLERHSALATAKPYISAILQMGELPGFTLIQAAGLTKDFDKKLSTAAGKLPPKIGAAVEAKGRTIMRIGPTQLWFVGPETDDLAVRLQSFCAVTPLSNSRTRILLDGAPARDVLAKGIPLDFHHTAFAPATFAMTGLHHTPILIHCTGEHRFELYAMRTFAMSIWEWLQDAALEYAE